MLLADDDDSEDQQFSGLDKMMQMSKKKHRKHPFTASAHFDANSLTRLFGFGSRRRDSSDAVDFMPVDGEPQIVGGPRCVACALVTRSAYLRE